MGLNQVPALGFEVVPEALLKGKRNPYSLAPKQNSQTAAGLTSSNLRQIRHRPGRAFQRPVCISVNSSANKRNARGNS
ncbi:hypothetical protein CaCOL14_004826 [Colletotrichum acutatum]